MKKWCWLWLCVTLLDAIIVIYQAITANGATPEIIAFNFSNLIGNVPFWLDSIWYVFNIIIINGLFAYCAYLLFNVLKKYRKRLPNFSVVIFLYLTFGALMVLGEQRFDITYPSYLYHPFNLESIEESLWIVSLIILTIAALGYVLINLRYWKGFLTVYVILAAIAYYPYVWGMITQAKDVKQLEKPNVVYILLDAVRPDHLKAGGAPFDIMPRLNQMIEEQGVFYQDITVSVGRSFPSAVALLTGKHAINNGIRDNIFSKENMDYSQTLAHTLKNNGYQTRLAVDGGQFWGFDEDFGFESLWSSGRSVVNMIPLEVGGFMPLPLLFANTRLGEIFFPYSYADRNIDSLYDTGALVQKIGRGLNFVKNDEPLFLFMSLDLPHTPYRDETTYSKNVVNTTRATHYADACNYYLASMNIVEDQLFDVLEILKQYGRMENTLLIIGSDHGQGFGMQKDQFMVYDGKPFNALEGFYGNSALTPSSTNLMLSIFSFSPNIAITPHVISQPVESIDIAPTILDALNIPSAFLMDGQSFKESFTQESQSENRPRFVESGFKSKLTFGKGQKEDVASLTRRTTFDLNTLTKHWNKEGELQIILNKDRAVYLGDWILLTEDFIGNPYIANRKTRVVWPITLAPSDAPTIEMLQAWCEHNRTDIPKLQQFGISEESIAQGLCMKNKQDELLTRIQLNQPYDPAAYEVIRQKAPKNMQFICTREHLY